jgi:hypothetical protein
MFELKDVFQDYFQENCTPEFAMCFEGEGRLQKLSYFADIFHHLNQEIKSLQGPRESVSTSSDKIVGFKRKMNPWKNHVVK